MGSMTSCFLVIKLVLTWPEALNEFQKIAPDLKDPGDDPGFCGCVRPQVLSAA